MLDRDRDKEDRERAEDKNTTIKHVEGKVQFCDLKKEEK